MVFPALDPAGYNNDLLARYATCPLVQQGLIVTKVTNCFLIGYVCSTGWSCKPGLKLLTGEIMGPRRKPTAVVLLTAHAVKFRSKHLCLYLQICAALKFGQESFFSQ